MVRFKRTPRRGTFGAQAFRRSMSRAPEPREPSITSSSDDETMNCPREPHYPPVIVISDDDEMPVDPDERFEEPSMFDNFHFSSSSDDEMRRCPLEPLNPPVIVISDDDEKPPPTSFPSPPGPSRPTSPLSSIEARVTHLRQRLADIRHAVEAWRAEVNEWIKSVHSLKDM